MHCLTNHREHVTQIASVIAGIGTAPHDLSTRDSTRCFSTECSEAAFLDSHPAMSMHQRVEWVWCTCAATSVPGTRTTTESFSFDSYPAIRSYQEAAVCMRWTCVPERHQAKSYILGFVDGAISWVTWVFGIVTYIYRLSRGLRQETWCEGDAVEISRTPQESGVRTGVLTI